MTQKADYSFDKVRIPNTRRSATIHNLQIDRWISPGVTFSGKIVESWNWSSRMERDAQLGVGPAAPAPKK